MIQTTLHSDSAWSQLKLGLALLILPALLALAGCDSSGNNNNQQGVNQSPDAAFSWSAEGLTATFNAKDSKDPDGKIKSYSWKFGDGKTATGDSVSHTYSAGGKFDVTLTVKDTAGASDDVKQTIDVEKGETTVPVNYANYDTTSSGTIKFRERDDNELGVVPFNAKGNDNVRSNYVKWTSDNTYVISGRTFVNPGDTLEIEPGTAIKGVSSQDPTNASVLIVAKGATILAKGTKDKPIVFTGKGDDLSDPGDVQTNQDGLWGGVIILGNGKKNFPGERSVEGIPPKVDRAYFGSSSPKKDYDAGIFKYVSIRYGGISIGAGNEINGLTMGALGTKTEIHHVEVYNNQDDGFEWFGGTVNAHHLVASRVGDDSYDIDQGYRGNLQFLLAIQTPNRGNRTGEHDSGDDGYGGTDEGDTPISNPQIYNATYIGSGPNGGGDVALKLRDNFGGDYRNSIFFDFPTHMIEVEDVSGTEIDARNQWETDELTVKNSIAWKFGAVQDNSAPYDSLSESTGSWGQTVADSLESYNVTYEDPGFSSRDLSGDIQKVGVIPGSAASGGADEPSTFFEDVDYKGAFAPGGSNWAKGWTFSDEVGMFK